MKESKLPKVSLANRGTIRDLGTIQDREVLSVKLNERITGFDGGPGSSAYQFSLDQQQDIFFVLDELDHDLDLYLTFGSWDDVKSVNPDTGKKEFVYANKPVPYIANSTEFSDARESIFARLAPGDYWIKVAKNSPLDRPANSRAPRLTVDAKTFGQTRTVSNDKYLPKQWYLFNTGISAFYDNSDDYAQIYSDSKDLFASEQVNGIIPNTDIYAPEAWNIQHDASNVVVAVVDQGVDISHPDLKNNIWTNKGEIPNDNQDNDGNGYIDDVNGWAFNFGGEHGSNDPNPLIPNHVHGTHVAGIIGAEGNNKIGISGVAWNTQIMPLNVSTEGGPLQKVPEAVRYSVDNGADIVNLSLGASLKISPAWLMRYMTSQGQLTDDAPAMLTSGAFADTINAFHQANKQDALLVLAAGNDGKYSNQLEQWKQVKNIDYSLSMECFIGRFFDNALTIGATDAMNNLSPFSNIGHSSDLAAPGGNLSGNTEFAILSTLPEGVTLKENITNTGIKGIFVDQGTYGYAQGTSMATPVVSGSAALVKAVNPDLSASEIRQVLLASARPNPRFQGEVGDQGLQLNLERALVLAKDWQGDKSFYQIRTGSNKNDQIYARSKRSLIRGKNGNDTITGNRGDDLIRGGGGKDQIYPGLGKDWINGGKGVDKIIYLDINESPIYKPDVVKLHDQDIFDLSNLDGDPDKPGIQKLKWIGGQEFTGLKSGEIQSRTNGFFVDMDKDKLADFAVLYDEVLPFKPSQNNFIL